MDRNLRYWEFSLSAVWPAHNVGQGDAVASCRLGGLAEGKLIQRLWLERSQRRLVVRLQRETPERRQLIGMRPQTG